MKRSDKTEMHIYFISRYKRISCIYNITKVFMKSNEPVKTLQSLQSFLSLMEDTKH